jgi:PTS system galactitol-specific IIA component
MHKVIIAESLVTRIDECLTKEAIIRRVAMPLLEAGLVKPSYADALIDRERSFPTGLPTGGVGVAIPHTDCEHVNQASVAVGILRHPVAFQNMAVPEEAIPVQILFMLAIDEPHGHVKMLQHLMDLVQNAEFLQALQGSPTAGAAWELLESFRSRLA